MTRRSGTWAALQPVAAARDLLDPRDLLVAQWDPQDRLAAAPRVPRARTAPVERRGQRDQLDQRGRQVLSAVLALTALLALPVLLARPPDRLQRRSLVTQGRIRQGL
jgi:hypothetical protein